MEARIIKICSAICWNHHGKRLPRSLAQLQSSWEYLWLRASQRRSIQAKSGLRCPLCWLCAGSRVSGQRAGANIVNGCLISPNTKYKDGERLEWGLNKAWNVWKFGSNYAKTKGAANLDHLCVSHIVEYKLAEHTKKINFEVQKVIWSHIYRRDDRWKWDIIIQD